MFLREQEEQRKQIFAPQTLALILYAKLGTMSNKIFIEFAN